MNISSVIRAWHGSLISFEISHPSYMTALRHQRQAQASNTTLYYVDMLEAPLKSLLTKPIDFVFIDAAKAHYRLFLEEILPYCSAHATIICDDVLAFEEKIGDLYTLLDERHLSYEHVASEEGDGLLIIDLSNERS